MTYYRETEQSSINKGERHTVELEETRYKLPRVLPQSHSASLLSPATSRQCLGAVVQWGSLLETQCPDSHIDTLCLECTRVSDSQAESRCWA